MADSTGGIAHRNLLPRSYYGIEICSGHGTVAKAAEQVLGIKFFTIDISTKFGTPDLLVDILDTRRAIRRIKRLADSYGCTVCAAAWASPECIDYSKTKTTGVKDLVAADRLVEAARAICQALGAKVMVIENPGTGSLAGREVISFIPASQVYDVDYCAYGATYKKHTKLWSTRNLKAAGFSPKRCPNSQQKGQLLCDATFRNPLTNRIRHIHKFPELTPAQRVSVPHKLANRVFQSVQNLLLSELTTSTSAPRLAAVPAVVATVARHFEVESARVVIDLTQDELTSEAAFPVSPQTAAAAAKLLAMCSRLHQSPASDHQPQQRHQQGQPQQLLPEEEGDTSDSSESCPVEDMRPIAHRSSKRQCRGRDPYQQLQYIDRADLVDSDLLLSVRLRGSDCLKRIPLGDLAHYAGTSNPMDCDFGSEKAQRQISRVYAVYCRLQQH